jgi:hypothetical protein
MNPRPIGWPGLLRRPNLLILLAASLLLAFDGPRQAPQPVPPRGGVAEPAAPTATHPAPAYVIRGKPSAVVQDHQAILALALAVERDLEAELVDSRSEDRSVLQRLHVGLYGIAMLKRDHLAARRHLARVRGLQEGQAGRRLTGVITEPYMEARERPGADLRATFRALLSERLAALPLEEVRSTLEAMKDGLKTTSREQLVGGVAIGLDPVVKDGRLTQAMASGLLSAAMSLEVILPLKEDVVSCIEAVLDATRTAAAPARPAILGDVATPLQGAYFGQAAPGQAPVPFAPELLKALSAWVEGVSFSPDGAECFLDVGDADYSSVKTYRSTRVDGAWTPFVEPSFLSGFSLSAEVVLSPDGGTLTFTGQKPGGSKMLWTTRRTDQGWSAPVALPPEINNGDRLARGSAASDGTRYFGRAPAGLHNQIYRARQDASQKPVVELLGAPINTQSYEGDPCIAPDGRFLVFYSGRIGGQGGTDLYVSFPDGRDGWTTPINLGDAYNGPYDEYGAHLSADGKYLFFTRHTPQGNGIYWVAASAIDRLRPGPR